MVLDVQPTIHPNAAQYTWRDERAGHPAGSRPRSVPTPVPQVEREAPSDTVAVAVAVVAGDQEHRADPALLQACLEGDERAWETLVERYGRLVHSVARKCGLGEADADDVFQVVFTTLFRRLHALRDLTRLSSWLITTAYRESWRVARGHRPTVDLDEVAAAVVDTGAPPADLVVEAERAQLVREGLSRLDDRCRCLLTALFLDAESPTYDAVGRRLGMPIGSIGPTRARCFAKLEAILGDLGVDGAG